MAGYDKKVKQKKQPKDAKNIPQGDSPERYYSYYPSWNFKICDKERWSLMSEEVQNIFWELILPRLQALETETWHNILVVAKKHNHSIDVSKLNKTAVDRLEELMIEAESIISLKVQGKYRIYGSITRGIFNLLWIDLDHGDNKTCVCRSHKKNT